MVQSRFKVAFPLYLALITATLAGIACDPGGYVNIENQTDQQVVIFWNGLRDVSVPPHSQVRTAVIEARNNRLEARNAQGTTVLKLDLPRGELSRMHWMVVIKPP